MLIIDKNSVYEIDEECLKKKKVPKECELPEKVRKEKKGKQIFSAEFSFIVTYMKEEEREGLFSIQMYAYKKFYYLYMKFFVI